jgi:hypothetical protein
VLLGPEFGLEALQWVRGGAVELGRTRFDHEKRGVLRLILEVGQLKSGIGREIS